MGEIQEKDQEEQEDSLKHSSISFIAGNTTNERMTLTAPSKRERKKRKKKKKQSRQWIFSVIKKSTKRFS